MKLSLLFIFVKFVNLVVDPLVGCVDNRAGLAKFLKNRAFCSDLFKRSELPVCRSLTNCQYGTKNSTIDRHVGTFSAKRFLLENHDCGQ